MAIDAVEAKALVHHLVKDEELQTIPGPTRGIVAKIRGIKEIDATGMHMVALSEIEYSRRKDNLRSRVANRLFGLPGMKSTIVMHDLAQPERSRTIWINSNNAITVVEGAPGVEGAIVRQSNAEDVDMVNLVFNNLLQENQGNGSN